MRVLLLAGTGEGRALARRLAAVPAVRVTTSLAGRVAAPHPLEGEVRTGGFGGVDGLVSYLRAQGVDAVVDATHPFAARMTARAVAACRGLGVPLLALRRPGWVAASGDDWRRVPDLASAAAAVARIAPAGSAVLLTLGRGGLDAFAADGARRYVIRSIDPPEAGTLPPHHTLVSGRGPFDVDGERALLRDHRVSLLVTKDSGGDATVAKLVAARRGGLPVVMVDRPPLPEGVVPVEDVAAATAWVLGELDRWAGSGSSPRRCHPRGPTRC
jgi:precorrin-6A/cobalt-precorrin-6A reductase